MSMPLRQFNVISHCLQGNVEWFQIAMGHTHRTEPFYRAPGDLEYGASQNVRFIQVKFPFSSTPIEHLAQNWFKTDNDNSI